VYFSMAQMRLRLVHYALAIAVFVAATALLNPSAEQHRKKIKQAVAERSQLAALLHLGDLAAFVSSYHSLGLASYTTANGKILSVGAFGIVIAPEGSQGP
jgi:hypothetical protein